MCGRAGCRMFVDFDITYCDKHKDDYSKQYNKSRWKNKNDYMKFYNSKQWKMLREDVLIENFYTCSQCGREGNIGDHIIPVEEDWNKRLDKNNIQVMCQSCHNIKTRNDERKYKK
ncbi:HNH endonuclease [Vagococcus fessus]|nr:HNH endonuclease [Vagococcus fessus]